MVLWSGRCSPTTGDPKHPPKLSITLLESNSIVLTSRLGTLKSGDTIQIHLDLYPSKAGPRQLQVLISSSEIKEMKGYKDIFVAAAAAP